MSAMSPQEVTQLLAAWSDGDRSALEKLLPLVADELHRLVHGYMNREREGHTLQTTALVNEAYLKLIDQRDVHWQNRARFFGIAAQNQAFAWLEKDFEQRSLSLPEITWRFNFEDLRSDPRYADLVRRMGLQP